MGSVPSPSRSSAAALRCCCVCNRRRSAETEIAATAATPDTPGHPGGRGRAALAYRGIVQAAKGLTGVDQHQVRRWTSWHRWTTLAVLAHAFLAVTTATNVTPNPHRLD
jgi:hypothetical protein